jgi:hypothetical protein
MNYEVWDKKKGEMVEISEKDKLIAYKRDDYGKKVLVEPAKLNRITSKHLVFVTESGMDILINKDSAGADDVNCFYSNTNNWSISLSKYEAFAELL